MDRGAEGAVDQWGRWGAVAPNLPPWNLAVLLDPTVAAAAAMGGMDQRGRREAAAAACGGLARQAARCAAAIAVHIPTIM